MFDYDEHEDGDITMYDIEELEEGPDGKTRYRLFDADGSDLNHHRDMILEAVAKNDMSVLRAIIDEMWEVEEALFLSRQHIVSGIRSELVKLYGKEKADRFFEDPDNEIALDQFVDDHNTTDPLKQLLANTAVVFYYHLEVDAYYSMGDDLDEMVQDIKDCLEVEVSGWDETFQRLILDSAGGGEMVVFFYADGDDIQNMVDAERGSIVKFTDPHIAIFNGFNGGGFDMQFNGLTLEMPFAERNLRIDNPDNRYSYSFGVFNKHPQWCEGTKIDFVTENMEVNT